MPKLSRFSAPRTNVAPSARNNPMEAITDMRGLDLTTPHDQIEEGRTPFAKNFRLYSEDKDSRRISVSTRKGPGEYLNPFQETANVSNTSTTGAAAKGVGIISNWRAMPFTPNANGRLTKLELNIRSGTGKSAIIVNVYTDDGNKPSDLLAESSILPASITSSYTYVQARFVEAPMLTSGTKYWIVAHVQEDGTDGYEWSSNTASALSMVSNANVSGMAATSFSLNFKTYLSPDYKDKGSTRFNQVGGINRTVVAYQDTMYATNNSGNLVPIISGLNSNATNYYFTTGDGKLFWVNNYDNLMAWNGSFTVDNTNLVTNGTFETDATGWIWQGDAAGGTVARSTADKNTGVASLLVSSANTGSRFASYVLSAPITSGQVYQVSFAIKATAGTTISYGTYTPPTASGLQTVTATGAWQTVTTTIRGTLDTLRFIVGTSASVNFYLDDVSVKQTGVEQIINANLPILRYGTFHKDRFVGVSASDPNKIVFSENPGNPSDQPANKQWYYAWLSVSFIYVPSPKNSDPITAIWSFQDTLAIFTNNNKYNLYGSDRGSLSLRQAMGRKGAVSQDASYADENFIYFVAADGIYRYNGSSDELLSDRIQSELDKITNPEQITIAKWKRQIRFYYTPFGVNYNTDCLLYHTAYEEWQHDTEVYVNRGVYWADGDDDRRLVETSSLVPAMYNAEQDYNNYGKPIDFAYYMKYESMGGPAQRKRILKLFPLIQGVGKAFIVSVDMDKDFADNPVLNRVFLTNRGAIWNEFDWGDGTEWGGDTTFKPTKLRYPGYAYYWQMRVSHKGVDNPVMFFGVQYSYKAKRL